MTKASPELARRTGRQLLRVTMLCSQAVVALIALSTWGHWRRFAIILAVQAARVVFNLVHERRSLRAARPMPTLLAAVNAAANVAIAHTAHWTTPALMYTVFQLVVIEAHSERPSAVRGTLVLLPSVVLATLDHVAPLRIVSMIVISGAVYAVGEVRLHAMRQLVQEIERLHATVRLQDKLSSIGVLAAGIAHEINNPMSYVTANVESMLADLAPGPLDEAVRREYVDDVLPATLEGVRRVNQIVADVRRFARHDGHEAIEYDLNAEIRAALRLCESKLKQYRVTVALGALPPLTGSPRQIGQVVMNLVLNAAQATSPGGELAIATRTDGETVKLEVRDHGRGMTPEVKARLFEPFFTQKAPGEGVGLGLSIVYGIVRAHGGEIAVDSHPGRGSAFTVSLPIGLRTVDAAA